MNSIRGRPGEEPDGALHQGRLQRLQTVLDGECIGGQDLAAERGGVVPGPHVLVDVFHLGDEVLGQADLEVVIALEPQRPAEADHRGLAGPGILRQLADGLVDDLVRCGQNVLRHAPLGGAQVVALGSERPQHAPAPRLPAVRPLAARPGHLALRELWVNVVLLLIIA